MSGLYKKAKECEIGKLYRLPVNDSTYFYLGNPQKIFKNWTPIDRKSIFLLLETISVKSKTLWQYLPRTFYKILLKGEIGYCEFGADRMLEEIQD